MGSGSEAIGVPAEASTYKCFAKRGVVFSTTYTASDKAKTLLIDRLDAASERTKRRKCAILWRTIRARRRSCLTPSHLHSAPPRPRTRSARVPRSRGRLGRWAGDDGNGPSRVDPSESSRVDSLGAGGASYLAPWRAINVDGQRAMSHARHAVCGCEGVGGWEPRCGGCLLPLFAASAVIAAGRG